MIIFGNSLKSCALFEICPKSKRALRISPPYLAEPVQKAYQRVFASMELLKIVLTYYPIESNNYPANSQCLPVKSTLDATFYKLHLKCWVNMCLRNTLDAASKASGYRPDLLHFLPKGKKIMVSNPSSRVRADVHRTSAFDLSNLVGSISPNKKDILVDVLLFGGTGQI